MHPRQSSKNQNLTDLASWASFAVQLIGYFPLASKIISGNYSGTTSHFSKMFKFTWTRSVLPYYSSLLTAASFTWCLVYSLRYKEFASLIEFKSTTEVAAYNLMIITSTLSGLYVKIFALVKGKQYQKFWEYTQILLAHFSASVSPELQKIRTSCRIELLLMLIPVTGHIIYFHVRPLSLSILDDWTSDYSAWSHTDTQLYFGLAFWTLFALLHVGNGIWMNFFVKVYTKCLKFIAADLKNLNPSQSKDSSLKDSHEDLSKIYQQDPSSSRHSFTSTSELKITLDKLMLVDHEITRFNEFFGNLLLLEVGNCVMNLLVYSFFACLWMGREKWDLFAETLIPLYLYGKELLNMGSVAEQLSLASEDVLNSVAEDVELGGLSEEMFLRVQVITVQLCTKPPIVTARQFFTINRSLVTSVMSALATFLVVLVQFRDQDDEDANEAALSKATKSIVNASTGRTGK